MIEVGLPSPAWPRSASRCFHYLSGDAGFRRLGFLSSVRILDTFVPNGPMSQEQKAPKAESGHFSPEPARIIYLMNDTQTTIILQSPKRYHAPDRVQQSGEGLCLWLRAFRIEGKWPELHVSASSVAPSWPPKTNRVPLPQKKVSRGLRFRVYRV